MKFNHCLAVCLALVVASSAKDEPTNVADEISKDSSVKFVQEIAIEEENKELNEFLKDRLKLEQEVKEEEEEEGSGNQYDTNIDNEEYDFYSSGNVDDEEMAGNDEAKINKSPSDITNGITNDNDFHFDEKQDTEDEEDEADYEDEDEDEDDNNDDLLYEYYNEDDDNYDYDDDYDYDDEEEELLEDEKVVEDIIIESEPEVTIVETSDDKFLPGDSSFFNVFKMSYLYVMLISAIVTFFMALVLFFVCRSYNASRQRKLVPFVVAEPRSYHQNVKAKPAMSPIVRNYQRVPTSTKDFLNNANAMPVKDHTSLDIGKPLLT